MNTLSISYIRQHPAYGIVKYVNYIFFISLILSSCNKRPQNVRELMESEGWNYCKLVTVDSYHERKGNEKEGYIEAWIYEEAGQYDLFKKGEDYAITSPHTDTKSLSGYDSSDEHLRASCWINYYIQTGDYVLHGDHAKKGTGRLGQIKKRYNAKTIGESVYFVISSIDSQQEESNTATMKSGISTDDYEIVEEEPAKKYKQCPLCYGTSRCGGCGGGGVVYNSIDYSPGQYVDCSSCNGSGTCGLCGGSGIVEDFGW